MRYLLTVICLVFLTASQSFALSCMEIQIEDSFKTHSGAKEHYILVTGQLTNKRGVVSGPEIKGGIGQRSENFTATFIGEQATRAGFDRPINTTVAVSVGCGGPWCGGIEIDTPMLTFLEITPYGHQLAVGPCGGAVFYHPKKDQIERVLQCLLGGVCVAQTR